MGRMEELKATIPRGTLEGIRPYLESWANANVRTNYDKAKKARARTLLQELNAAIDAATPIEPTEHPSTCTCETCRFWGN